MIKREEITTNGITLIHTYSDTYYIQKKGKTDLFVHAYDPKSVNIEYVESNIELPKEEEKEN